MTENIKINKDKNINEKNIINKDKKYICEICGEKFYFKNTLINHIDDCKRWRYMTKNKTWIE